MDKTKTGGLQVIGGEPFDYGCYVYDFIYK